MTAVTIHTGDSGAQKNKICHCFHFPSFYLPWSVGTRCHEFSFFNTFSSQRFHSLTLIKKLFSSSVLYAIGVGSSAHLRLLIFLPAVLVLAFDSSSLVFHMMYSVYKLSNQGDNIQPWRTPFPILNQSVVLGLVLTVASWPADRFLRRQVRWSGLPISLRIFHSLLWSTQSKALV